MSLKILAILLLLAMFLTGCDQTFLICQKEKTSASDPTISVNSQEEAYKILADDQNK